MEENHFVPNTPDQTSEKTSKSVRENKSKDGKAEAVENSKKSGVKTKFDWSKFKITIGSAFTLLSLFLFLACISYLFTWTLDQDKVLNRSLFDFLFDSAQEPVDNWLGKFGAWTSHLLIYRLFGISSFILCFLLFLTGIKILFGKSIFHIGRSFTIGLTYMIWTSVLLGYFSYSVNYLGGTFGFYLNEWMILTIGKIGAISLLIMSFYVLTAIQFNPNLAALFSYFKNDKSNDSEIENEERKNTNEYEDILVVNTIKEEQIKKDAVSETVDFSDEDDADFDESELIVTIKEDDDFEIEIGQETNEQPIEVDSITEKVMSKHGEEDVLAAGLVAEFGEYDPKKDLEGYILPPIDLLRDFGNKDISINKEELESNKNKIVQTLSHYKIDIAKIKATVGPTVTLYEIVPAPGVRISKIKNLEDDIALSLSALGIRIIAPIPGKGTIGIEVPNSNPEMVSMHSLISSDKFQNFDGELPVVLGRTITNETYVFDLTKLPHLLVAGSTGQGKSVGLNAILVSILYKKHPAQVKFVLVDPKKVELTLYNKIERHFLAKLPGEEDAIITDTSKVVNTLNSLCVEMDNRYELLKDAGVRTIKEYNAKFISRRLNPEKGHYFMPYIVVLIDEFADLIMTAGKEIEHPIARIAQLARAIGIHLIVATQRPSVNVITGMIKANFPARIAFRVLSKIDSRTILDASGADQLIGRGDMLISTGSDIIRLQCGFVDTAEVEDICSFIGEQRAFPEALILPEYTAEGGDNIGEVDMNEIDSMFVDSARIIVINQQGSASLLQRKLKLGYNRAGRIVDQLEAMGIIGTFQGSKPRDVLYTDIESLDELLRSRGLI